MGINVCQEHAAEGNSSLLSHPSQDSGRLRLIDHSATSHALIQFELPKERLHCVYAQVHKAITSALLLLVTKGNLFSAFPRVLSPFSKVKQAQKSLFDRETLLAKGDSIGKRLENRHSQSITSALAKEPILKIADSRLPILIPLRSENMAFIKRTL